MANEDTVQPSWYAPWPNLGKKFSQQLGEIRTDTAYAAPLVRGMGLDADGDFSTLDDVEANAVQSREWGKFGFHNKFRIHYDKTNDLLDIAYNTGTETVPNWYTTWKIDNDGNVTQQNSPTTVSNIGSGSGWFKQKVGNDLEFKSVTATSPITLTAGANSIDIDGSALVSTYSSDAPAAPSGDADTGVEIILSDTGKVGNDLPFKALKAGPNVVIRTVDSASKIEIESTAQVVEFYGITVAHSDNSAVFPEVHNFKVNVNQFYVTQETTNPSQKTTILNFRGDVLRSEDFVAVVGDQMTGQLQMHDGTAGAPSIGFTSDPDTGIRLRATDDLALTVGGTDRVRVQDDLLLTAVPMQITNAGTASAPDYSFFPDINTGIYQNSPDDDSIAFATAGVRAGYFTHGQDFYVSNKIFVGNGTAAAPSYSFGSDQGLGIFRNGAGRMDFAVGGSTFAFFSDATTAFNSGVPMRGSNATAGSPSFSFQSATDLGIWRKSTTQLGFAAGGLEAGYFDDNLDLYVTNDILTGNGSAANPSHTFSATDTMGMYRIDATTLGFATSGTLAMDLDSTGLTVVGDVTVDDDAYAASWDGNLTVPTKNAVYDKIETIGGGFYGITIKQSDDSVAFRNLNTVSFDVGKFYLTQNAPNTDEVQINLRGIVEENSSPVWTGNHTFSGGAPTVTFQDTTSGHNNYTIKVDDDDFTIAPSVIETDVNTIILDSQVNVWPNMPDITGAVEIVTWSPDLSMSSTFPTYRAVANIPTITSSGTVPAINTVYEAGTYTTTTTPAASSMILFNAVPMVQSQTTSVQTMAPVVYQSAYIIKADGVDAGTYSGSVVPTSFAALPTISSTGAAGAYTLNEVRTLASDLALTTNNASGTIDVTSFNDIICLPTSGAGAGTETITNRNMVYMQDDPFPTNLTGILSEINSGPTALFIDHQGTAASVHTGEFYLKGDLHLGDKSIRNIDSITFRDTAGTIAGIQNANLLDKSATETVSGSWDFDTTAPTVVDEVYGGSWDGSLEVPTKNALYDKIETIGGGGGGGFYGITVKQTDGLGSFSGINVVNFLASQFYVTQNSPNTDEVIVSGRDWVEVGDSPSWSGQHTFNDFGPIIDVTSTEALLVRKNQDAGDMFTVDTTNNVVTIGNGSAGDSALEFHDTGSLAWTVGFDDSATEFVITSGAMDGTNNEISLAPDKLAFFNTTPIAQQTTTSQTPATFAANTSGIVNDSATWNGYTIGDIVAILQAYGLIA